MSKIFGDDKSLIIQDELDSDGDLLISMPIFSSDMACTDTYIDREDAIKIMEHLQSCFGI
ncbi:hypothetical protein KAR91_45415 [Candidatus Pacearchaeota archaeon]|nr:hypothetical protein [Candidatus Pacearchaeota archaeon]